MKNVIKILHLEDNPADSELVKTTLQLKGIKCQIQRVDTEADFRSALEEGGFNLILSDSVLPSFRGKTMLTVVKQKCPQVPLIFFSAHKEDTIIKDKLNPGAASYVQKPNIAKLTTMIEQTLSKIDRQKPFAHIQDTLKARHSLLEKACEAAHIGYWQSSLHADGTLIWSSEVFKIFGVDKNNFDGKVETFYSLVHPKDLEAVIQAGEFAVFDNEPYNIEHRIIKPDGTVRWVLQSGNVIKDESGNPLWLIGIIQDITDRKGAEQRIHEKAALVDQLYDAIIVQDLSDRILLWSKGAEKLYGWGSRHAVGKTLAALLHLQPDPKLAEAQRTTIQQGTWNGEFIQLTKGNKPLNVQSRWSLLHDSEGIPKSILIISNESTTKKSPDVQSLHKHQLESMTKFAGGVAHDFNNILGPITIAVDLLGKKISDPATQKILSTVDTSVKRGADLTKLVLGFARSFDGEQTFFEANPMLQNIVSTLKGIFPLSVQIETTIDERPSTIFGNEPQINHAIMNLCTNALEAMPSGGTLSFHAQYTSSDEILLQVHPTAKTRTYFLLTIKDTGQGIPPTIINKIFEPFFTTKKGAKGTGLGLTTALAIIENHGGFIDVLSEAGKGSEFKVFLPIVEPEDKKNENPT
ncbi:MAG: PAS domain-containing protein, partial [Ignavibacteriales bacterium]|nr:PAS domain-containing protein [Ignavibacteriales bacterium]